MERYQDEAGTSGDAFVLPKAEVCRLASDIDEVRERSKGAKAN